MNKGITIRIVGILLVLWNIMGVYSFVHDYSMTPMDLAKLPANQAAMYAGMHSWEWGVYAIGTITGLVSALGIAVKKGWAMPVALVSLIAVTVQFTHAFFAQSGKAVWEPGAIYFVGFIMVISALQYYLARRWCRAGLMA